MIYKYTHNINLDELNLVPSFQLNSIIYYFKFYFINKYKYSRQALTRSRTLRENGKYLPKQV